MSYRVSRETSFKNEISASERLEIGIDEQLLLFYALTGLTKTLGKSHLQPIQTKATLLGIPLKTPPRKFDEQRLTMALNYSAINGGDTSAEISVTDTHHTDSSQYNLMPNESTWSVKQGKYSSIRRYLEHSELIEEINPLLPGTPILDHLLDGDPTGLNIITMLEQRLRYLATSKDSANRYHNDQFAILGGDIEGDEYVSNAETDFTIVKS